MAVQARVGNAIRGGLEPVRRGGTLPEAKVPFRAMSLLLLLVLGGLLAPGPAVAQDMPDPGNGQPVEGGAPDPDPGSGSGSGESQPPGEESKAPDSDLDEDAQAELLAAAAASSELEPVEEFNKKIRPDGLVSPLGDNAFGENVSLYDGSTTFQATDVDLPGNSALPVRLSRYFKVMNRRQERGMPGLADWEIDVPRLYGDFFAGKGWKTRSASPYSRCSIPAEADAAAVWNGTEYPGTTNDVWHGYHMHLPGSGDQELLVNDQAKLPMVQMAGSFPWVTRDFTRLGCLTSTKNGYPGEGFFAITADGTKYYFDHAISHSIRGYRMKFTSTYEVPVGRERVHLAATRVEDRFGNWVDYTYTGDLLTGITASDGRAITLNYSNGRLASATAHGRTWTYEYELSTAYPNPQGDYRLKAVQNPDASRWTYEVASGSLLPQREPPPDGGNNNNCLIAPDLMDGQFGFRVTAPSGGVALFEFAHSRLYRAHTPRHFCDTPIGTPQLNPYIPHFFDVYGLYRKTVSGPGLTNMVWTYGISPGSIKFYTSGTANDPCPTCIPSKNVTVTAPDGSATVYEYGNMYGLNEGRLLSVKVRNASGTVLSTTSHTYVTDAEVGAQAFPKEAGGTLLHLPNALSNQLRPIKATTIVQDGATFSSTVPSSCAGVLCFDAFARTQQQTRSSSLGYSRSDTTEYQDDYTRWVLGQVKRSLVNGTEASRTEFNAATLPWKRYQFGALRQTLTYEADGTVSTVKDGNNRTTTLSNWYRGIPRSIKHPDNRTQLAVVHASGWVTSVTDENGYTTGYGYDSMGRLASITPPSGDSTAWNTTTQVFEKVNAVEYGIPAGHWRQTVSTGNARRITYYDGLWRPLLTREYDTANQAGTQRFQRFSYSYDANGSVTFQSYPGTTDALSTGVWKSLDPLGRLRGSTQTSELGTLTTTYTYLPGFQTRVTDPKGNQTTTSFQAWDQPTYDYPVSIVQPEGVHTDIARDAFGKPTAITQRNAASSLAVTRHYVYDAYQQLCKSIEPETGSTVLAYDNAGNLSWSASGLALPSTTACNTANVSASQKISRAYDARNRLLSMSVPGGNGSQEWSYTPDGLPSSVTTYNDGGASTVVNAYTYNKRRLLTGESQVQTGASNWAIGYGYNGNGHLTSLSYPASLTVNYLPNALGQPTQAGPYATGVQYYPNGAIKQFTYGNGIVHTMTQNARQRPARSTDSGDVLDLAYAYDANGNVASISDHTSLGRQTRSMGYDGRDRLLTVASPLYPGGATYAYDVLDNLTRVTVAGRDHRYLYDASNRLTNVTQGAGGPSVMGLGYDVRGNLNNRNGQVYQFDVGNRLRTALGTESYRYDAWGRRILTVSGGGLLYEMYSKEGQLLWQRDELQGLRFQHIWLGGSLVASRRLPIGSTSESVSYRHTDALGSPIAATGDFGSLDQRTEHEPYGKMLNRANDNRPGYTGHMMDKGTGLVYMQQRYYDPQIGRFLSVDPVNALSDPVGYFGRYHYAANNPYKFVDPDGRQWANTGTANPWPEVQRACGGSNSCEQEVAGDLFKAEAGVAGGALFFAVPDPSDLIVGAAVGRLALGLRASSSFPRAKRYIDSIADSLGPTGGRAGRRTTEFDGQGGESGAANLFNRLTRGESTPRDGGRLGSLGDGSRVQMSTRTMRDGTRETSVRITSERTGSHIKDVVKVRFREKP